MKLALRKTAPKNATILQKISCWVIKTRLVSAYCHGGIVIDGALYHSTSAKGLHRLDPGQWTPENWEFFELDSDPAKAFQIFKEHEGSTYDWIGLLAYVGLQVNNKPALYCFEWCWLAITGELPTFRVTPELLLRQDIFQKSRVAS